MSKTELFEDFIFKDPCVPEHKSTEKWDVYAKNTYCPKIKITDWWYHRESYPKDYDDPYNAIKSCYNRLGTWKEDESHWTTETQETMAAGRGDSDTNAFKSRIGPSPFLNFLSYPVTLKTRKDLAPEEVRKILPSLPKDLMTLRYTTTNQSHYKKVHIFPK